MYLQLHFWSYLPEADLGKRQGAWVPPYGATFMVNAEVLPVLLQTLPNSLRGVLYRTQE